MPSMSHAASSAALKIVLAATAASLVGCGDVATPAAGPAAESRAAAAPTAAHTRSTPRLSAQPAPPPAHDPAIAAEKPRITGGPQPALRVLPPQVVASGASPLPSNCGFSGGGTTYIGAEVEPYLAINPLDPQTLVGAWQQDRWSNGSARALVAATSRDGGRTWVRTPLPFSRCGGGNVMNGGDYERASDPWVTYSPDGTVHAMSLSTRGGAFQLNSANAMLASRSLDHGLTWSAPQALILDDGNAFNDKNTMTADPYDARYVYAVWDRLMQNDTGPAYFARSSNGGASWEPARPIYDPGVRNQTIGNLIVVLPSGRLVNVFTRISYPAGQVVRAWATAIHSDDRGVTWSAPVQIAEMLSVGTVDPINGMRVRDGAIVPAAAAGPDGAVYVAWQDARFSAGSVDAIALARSDDGGITWSAPLRASALPNVAAFTPALRVDADGTLGLTYYDLRNDSFTAPFLADAWLARSVDRGETWVETRLGQSFDLSVAPNAGGLFLGDYTGLLSHQGSFLPFFARANVGESVNRTDIVFTPVPRLESSQTVVDARARRQALRARQAPVGFQADGALRARVSARLRARLRQPPMLGMKLLHL